MGSNVEKHDVDRPEYELRPTRDAGPPDDVPPVRPRPSDAPVPRLSGGGPSLVDQDPDPDSALGDVAPSDQ